MKACGGSWEIREYKEEDIMQIQTPVEMPQVYRKIFFKEFSNAFSEIKKKKSSAQSVMQN